MYCGVEQYISTFNIELAIKGYRLLKNELRPLNRFDRLNNRIPPKMTVVKDTFLHFSQLIQKYIRRN